MPQEIKDLSRLCIHTQTNRPWNLLECAESYRSNGVPAITVWRNALEGMSLADAKKILDDNGMQVVSLCRGGFFPSVDATQRQASIDDNLLAIEQAAAIGAPLIVLVCGADGRQPLETSREQIMEGIHKILPVAKAANITLAIEPLHPMYAGDRSAVNTLQQANDMAEEINSPYVGVAVDVYHLWWDDHLEKEVKRCGNNGHLFAFHICDWKLPTTDMLLDRGLMGEGSINVPQIRGWVEEAGFTGFNEVEIFSSHYWQQDQQLFLKQVINAYLHHS
ncbi:MAG TPA: sugar phosphate isomerase/epimerase family protein [Chitinophagaceae bacterium]|nr:sugar phosphate isomerase/epimerase family protein [Chitinophagaceae bacterium]